MNILKIRVYYKDKNGKFISLNNIPDNSTITPIPCKKGLMYKII